MPPMRGKGACNQRRGMEVIELKHSQLERIARHREKLRKEPHLRWLFFEITNRCNLNCVHCGSRCSSSGEALSVKDVETTLSSVLQDKPAVCLTGGEPMLHPEFFDIAECVHGKKLFPELYAG